MKNWIVRGSVLTAMVLALTLSTAVRTSMAAPKPQPAAPAMHPEIHDALDALERAKAHLHDARHDFGGHRVDAIAAINAAERQLNICMKYDN